MLRKPSNLCARFAALLAAFAVVVALAACAHPASNPATGSKQPCNSSSTAVVFTAKLADPGANEFGPAQNYHTKPLAVSRFKTKACADPLFFAVVEAFKVHGNALNTTSVQNNAADYAKNRAAWAKDVRKFEALIKGYGIEQLGSHYETLGMIPGSGTSMPTLVRADRNVVAGYVLVLYFKDGTIRKLRIVCDLQPVSIVTFSEVPTSVPVTTPPPSRTTPTSSSTPTSHGSTPATPRAPPSSTRPTCQSGPCGSTPPSTHSVPPTPSSTPTHCVCVTPSPAPTVVPAPTSSNTVEPTSAPTATWQPTGPVETAPQPSGAPSQSTDPTVPA